MKWYRGRTTGNSLLRSLQALNKEDLKKNIIVPVGFHLCRPLKVCLAEDCYGDCYKHLKDNLVLDLCEINISTATDWEQKNESTPEPIIKDGKTICPCCGKEVVRSPSVMLSAPPIYTYYCIKCTYYREIRQWEPIKEARIAYHKISEEYNEQPEI